MGAGNESRKKFRRAETVRDLRLWNDPRWKKAAKLDLVELADDEEGLERLSAAIKAILRGRQP